MNSKKTNIIMGALALSLAIVIGLCVGLFLNFNKPAEIAYADSPQKVEVNTITDPVSYFSFREVAANVLESVVEVDVVQIEEQTVYNIDPFSLFEEFFGGNRRDRKGEDSNRKTKKEYRLPGLGSGVIVKQVGETYYVLTNNHVVQEADEIEVTLNSGKKIKAKLVGKDPRIDLALISFNSQASIPVATLGDSDDLAVGDWVLACGSPFGFMSTVTAGIVSAKNRRGPDSNISDFIQTDAAINSGNSGGPLVNVKGEVVGINTWIATKTGESAGLGFSIPINNAKRVIEDFINEGEVVYGWVGATVGNLPEDFIDDLGIKDKTLKGSFIINTYIDGPADKGGLAAGDLVVAVDSNEVKDSNDFVQHISNKKPGQKVKIQLYRDGNLENAIIKIGKRPVNFDKFDKTIWPGIYVRPIDEQIVKQLNLKKHSEGVVIVDVDKTSKAAEGLQVGDIIKSINDVPIKTISDFYKAIRIEKNRYLIEYERDGVDFFWGIKK